LVVTPFDYEDLERSSRLFIRGRHVSFLVLLRGGDDALGTLAAAFSLLALFLCYFVYI
jgi:hypothetical protein